MELYVRPYTPADLKPVASIWWRSWQSTGIAAPGVTPADLLKRFPEEVARGWAVYVAILGPDVIGFLALSDDTLEQLFITPEMQSQGIGKQLLDFAKDRRPKGFDLITAAESRAVAFYDREGLQRGETGQHPEYGHKIVTYHWRPVKSAPGVT